MSVTIDNGVGEVVVFADSVARWDDDPSTGIDGETKRQIVRNVTRALEWAGHKVRVC